MQRAKTIVKKTMHGVEHDPEPDGAFAGKRAGRPKNLLHFVINKHILVFDKMRQYD